MCVTIYNLIKVIGDERARKKNHVNGILKDLSLQHITGEILRVCTSSIIVVIGSVSMATRPAVKGIPLSPVGIVLTVGLVLIAFLVTVKSIVDAYFRRKVRRHH